MSKRSRGSKPATPAPRTAPAGTGSSAPRGVETAAVRRSRAPGPAPRRSRFERYRGLIIGAVIVAIVAIGGAWIFLGATQPAYACGSILVPEPSATPAADATPRLGQVTQDLGRTHVETGAKVTYDFCPPTSGPHYQDARFGPIAPRFYGPDDATVPEGWVHNLEHGQMVVLYRCPEGCTPAAQEELRALQGQIPASPLCALPPTSTVVVTRFDDLPTPYAVVTWGRVMFLDTLDVPTIIAYHDQNADRGPEPQCQNAVPGAEPVGRAGGEPVAAGSRPASPVARADGAPVRLIAYLDDLGLPVSAILEGEVALPLHLLAARAGLREELSYLDPRSLLAEDEDLAETRSALERAHDTGLRGVAASTLTRAAPLEPGKIVCVGHNYATHVIEQGLPLPTRPMLFAKFANAVIGPGEAVIRPATTHALDLEAELAVVIGRRARRVGVADALAHVAAYTVGQRHLGPRPPGEPARPARGRARRRPMAPGQGLRHLPADRPEPGDRRRGRQPGRSRGPRIPYGEPGPGGGP